MLIFLFYIVNYLIEYGEVCNTLYWSLFYVLTMIIKISPTIFIFISKALSILKYNSWPNHVFDSIDWYILLYRFLIRCLGIFFRLSCISFYPCLTIIFLRVCLTCISYLVDFLQSLFDQMTKYIYTCMGLLHWSIDQWFVVSLDAS